MACRHCPATHPSPKPPGLWALEPLPRLTGCSRAVGDAKSGRRRKRQLKSNSASFAPLVGWHWPGGGRSQTHDLRKSCGWCKEHWHIGELQSLAPALLPPVLASAELIAVAGRIGLSTRQRRCWHDRDVTQWLNHTVRVPVLDCTPEGQPSLARVPTRKKRSVNASACSVAMQGQGRDRVPNSDASSSVHSTATQLVVSAVRTAFVAAPFGPLAESRRCDLRCLKWKHLRQTS
jgi:hypothetical protein